VVSVVGRIAGLLTTAALALAVAACGSGGIHFQHNSISGSDSDSGSDARPTERVTYRIDEPVGAVNLDARSGSITVTAGPGPVGVTEQLYYTDDRPATSHQVTGDTLALREDGCAHLRSVNGRCEVNWEIHAPAGTALSLATSAGMISVTGFAGPVELSTHSGGIKAHRLSARTVSAESNAGGVRLAFVAPPDQVTATTDAGGVEIELPGGISYAVRADTATGTPDVDVARDADSSHQITARTGAGSIEISNG
jgi:hypothetical protein